MSVRKCVLCEREEGTSKYSQLYEVEIKDHATVAKNRTYGFYQEELEDIPDGIHLFCRGRSQCRRRLLAKLSNTNSPGSWKEQCKRKRQLGIQNFNLVG